MSFIAGLAVVVVLLIGVVLAVTSIGGMKLD